MVFFQDTISKALTLKETKHLSYTTKNWKLNVWMGHDLIRMKKT
jgi:hypothetical protein